jgi:hypothetical protein
MPSGLRAIFRGRSEDRGIERPAGVRDQPLGRSVVFDDCATNNPGRKTNKRRDRIRMMGQR